jgi:hypothetical protein
VLTDEFPRIGRSNVAPVLGFCIFLLFPWRCLVFYSWGLQPYTSAYFYFCHVIEQRRTWVFICEVCSLYPQLSIHTYTQRSLFTYHTVTSSMTTSRWDLTSNFCGWLSWRYLVLSHVTCSCW